MKVINRIERLLIDAGVPPRSVRRELSDTCGVSYQAVRDWFNGDTQKISPDYIAAIAKKWGSTSDYLITGDRSTLRDPAELIENQIARLSPAKQFELYEKLSKRIHESLKDQ